MPMTESLSKIGFSNSRMSQKTSHRFGGTEFQVHGLEFMLIHGTLHLDIMLSKEE